MLAAMKAVAEERWVGLGRGALLCIVIGLTALAYVPAVRGEFQFDDYGNVDSTASALWGPSLSEALLNRPLTNATFALNRMVTGTHPVALHLTNIVVHLAASLLAWRLVRCAFREARHPRAEPLALATAGLFALHPIQSEAVAYLVQRGEALASALVIGGLPLFLLTGQLWV